LNGGDGIFDCDLTLKYIILLVYNDEFLEWIECEKTLVGG